jgi:serine/threonine protein kinase
MDTVVQKGGKLLGSGATGCVFTPPLLCEGEKAGGAADAGKTSKLLDREEGIEELKFAAVLRKIPNSRNYFIYSDSEQLCRPAPESEQKEEDMLMCDIIYEQPLNKLYMYKMPNGGSTIHDIRISLDTFDWWSFGRHLLEGLSLLIVHGIVHGDLHSGNILIDDYKVPRLIDWGHSYRIQWATDSQMEKLIYKLRLDGTDNDFRLTQYPPEYYLFTAAKKGVDLDSVVEKLITHSKRRKLSLDMSQLLGTTEDDIRGQITQFMTSSIFFRKAGGDGGVKFMRNQGLYKQDPWSLGFFLITRLAYVDRYYGILSQPQYAGGKKEKMMATLRGLCNFNPLRRLTAIQALALWDGPNNKVVQRYGSGWI